MAKQLQLRRGTTSQHSTFTGANGEVTIDTDKKVVVVHDGATAGGIPLAKQATVDTKVVKVTSTDNAIVRFNGTTGDVQNSGVTIDDSNSIFIPGASSGTNGGAFVLVRNGATSNIGIGNYSALNGGAYDATSTLWCNGGLNITDNTTSRIKIDANGNIGIGATPSAWHTSFKAFEIMNGCALWSVNGTPHMYLTSNVLYDGTYKYIKSGNLAAKYEQSGSHSWSIAPTGTAGSAIAWTQAMTLDASGNLLLGAQSGSTHTIQKITIEDGAILYLYGGNDTYSAVFARADGIGHNGASTALRIQKNSSTLRSINAAGTINASGADYAEYEYSNDITIVKGQIVGFKADGTLTDKYSEAIRFAIKSTNPSIVGGDTWGIEDKVGIKPQEPAKTEEITDEEFAKLEEQYKVDLADFEARLEAERQKVDRIAYAGKVPVNVYNATPGQYIVAIEKDGGIDGLAVNKADMTFAQYQDAVGRVNKILDDGRAEVAVIIH